MYKPRQLRMSMTTENIRLIFEGKKTETRRIISDLQDDPWAWEFHGFVPCDHSRRELAEFVALAFGDGKLIKPHYRVGDLFWMTGPRRWVKIIQVKPPHRIQGITAFNCEAEGIQQKIIDGVKHFGMGDIWTPVSSKHAFQLEWEKLYGPRAWDRNDWVFPYVIEPTENPNAH